jgi:ACS family glucarate transporter-like MFS transporter
VVPLFTKRRSAIPAGAGDGVTSAKGNSGRRFRVRWSIFSFLFAFAFVAYVQRTSVAIAAERMMPELGLTQIQIGWLLTAFLMSYTAFQFPGGVFGQRKGARWTLVILGLLAFGATAMTAGAPVFLHATGLLFFALLAARFVLGLAQAPIFPVCSGAIENWFPVAQWPMPQGLLNAGLNLGSAVTPPLIVSIMQAAGWQFALVATSVPAVALIAWWAVYGRDLPTQHRSVSASEQAELRFNPPVARQSTVSLGRIVRLLGNRDVLLLTTSYGLMNYVFYLLTFWCFLYLVQERHFSVLQGGWLAALPFVAAAAGSAVGGAITQHLCNRIGTKWGYRIVPLVALPFAAMFLALVGWTVSAYWAVVALCGAFACIEVTEASFWAATMRVAPSDSMSATGVLNTGGNLGGIIATPIVAMLSAEHHWAAAFVTGTGCALASAALWLRVDVLREADRNVHDVLAAVAKGGAGSGTAALGMPNSAARVLEPVECVL